MGDKSKTLYSIRPLGDGFRVSKLDEDFNDLGGYNLIPDGKGYICDCPAHTPWCRHKQMWKAYKDAGKFNTGDLYDFDKKEFTARPVIDV